MARRNNPEPATAGEVLRCCLRHWHLNKDQIIPRCYLSGWEADLLVIKPSGWCEEVEIKVSAADFRAEWTTKAHKHEDLLLGACRYVGHPSLLGARGIAEDDPRVVTRNGLAYLRDLPTLIRRFWFAMPATLAEKLLPEVPEHYGVVAAHHYGCQVLRPATNLKPARKVTAQERIKALHSTYFRFWQLQLREPLGALETLTGEVSPESIASFLGGTP